MAMRTPELTREHCIETLDCPVIIGAACRAGDRGTVKLFTFCPATQQYTVVSNKKVVAVGNADTLDVLLELYNSIQV